MYYRRTRRIILCSKLYATMLKISLLHEYFPRILLMQHRYVAFPLMFNKRSTDLELVHSLKIIFYYLKTHTFKNDAMLKINKNCLNQQHWKQLFSFNKVYLKKCICCDIANCEHGSLATVSLEL